MGKIMDDVKRGMKSIDPADTSFDNELMMYLNGIFFKLHQLGIGPETQFIMDTVLTTWESFSTNAALIAAVKPYICAECLLQFDPPTNGSLYNATVAMRDQYEWRLTDISTEWRKS